MAMAEVEAELAREHTMLSTLTSKVHATKIELDDVRNAQFQSENEKAELRESVAQLQGEAASRSKELGVADLKVRPATGPLSFG